MTYDAQDHARLRIGVLLASAAAWAAMVATPDMSCHGSESLASAASGWMVMMVAMMAPMTLRALYHIRISSFADRRWRSSALFLTGYGLVWMVAGGVLKAVESAARQLAPHAYGPAVAVGLIACIWQASPIKQRCLNRCHSHRSLAAFGGAADWDALLMGLDHGFWCAGSCWALMLFPMLLPQGHLVAMAAVTVLMVCERLDPPSPSAWRLRGFRTAWRWLHLRLFGSRGTPPRYPTAAPPRIAPGQ
jgi:predicted metal-binding membrane protein